ncbi:MAG: NusG domain II-containing protein [Clostridia bacterium]|nr:NusG domain II-containing protein [Clostridia bacterium]
MQEYTKKSLRLDIIVIGIILAIALLLFALLLLFRREGAVAVVEVGGEYYATYSLYEDGEYVLNGGTNILVIENGEAYMKYADCPDGVCKNTGRVKYNGQSIICLPNRVSVMIESGEMGDGGLVS